MHLQVYNVGALTEQILEMYFKHNRSGGGPIQDIEMNKQEDYAIISFEKYGGLCMSCILHAAVGSSRFKIE